MSEAEYIGDEGAYLADIHELEEKRWLRSKIKPDEENKDTKIFNQRKQLKNQRNSILKLQQENEQLKQQLAEKDKLLEKENKALEIACKKIEDLRFENADICDYEYNEIKTEIRIKLLLEEAEEALKKLNKE